MSKKENLQGNEVVSTLYVGVGGIGSKIISRVVDTAVERNDDISRARFVIFDTDVGDLKKSKDGVHIVPVQTSSPRTIRDYLLQDEGAREEWFPNNMIINGKTVSEGAGQVRAISRLALNATIKTGRINALYRAIDELCEKDGSEFKTCLKVIIASTVAGGTGSGIAMIVGMLIRDYLAKKYSSVSAMIRGYLLMPDVMEASKPAKSTSEILSLERNGYATLKEINAFMMRPFFEAVPELNRYLDLHVDVPNSDGGVDRLANSPFDFCFLFERTDANSSNIPLVPGYIEYAAQSIYEQSIGPMGAKASSQEDNIHKEFLNEKKLGRNRFGGAGASILRYPYESIRDFIAYEWVEKQVIGHSSAQLSEDEMKRAISESWMAFDEPFYQKEKDFISGNTNIEPNHGQEYMDAVEKGNEEFTKKLREKYIDVKNNANAAAIYERPLEHDEGSIVKNMPNAVKYFIRKMEEQCKYLYEKSEGILPLMENLKNYETQDSLANRCDFVTAPKLFINRRDIEKVVAAFVERNFNSSLKITKKSEPFSIEAFMSIDGRAMHPNAMRYFLYALQKYVHNMPDCMAQEKFDEAYNNIFLGKKNKDTGEREITIFDIDKSTLFNKDNEKEENLHDMAEALDGVIDDPKFSGSIKICKDEVAKLANVIQTAYNTFINYYICQYSRAYVDRLVGDFEKFYESFKSKVTSLEKRKKTASSAIRVKAGSNILNLFSDPAVLQLLADQQKAPSTGSEEERDLFASIYDAVKENGKNKDILKSDSFADASVKDVFDEVVVEQYKKIVESACPHLDVDILQAAGLEAEIIAMNEARKDPKNAEELIRVGKSNTNKNAHFKTRWETAFNLASPCLIRKSFEEDRKIEAAAFNDQIIEANGMEMPETLFNNDYASNTVSKYEMRFFRSIYGIMPTELHKMTSPQKDPGKLDRSGTADDSAQADAAMVGEYFRAYQEYMRKIGPDNRLNPVITPHIDKRWNSITVMPELDPQGYQRVLMKRIHKALIYGVLYKRIEKRRSSSYDDKLYIYEYIDGRNGTKKLTVSNHTCCDRLFEVLDALYFDRYAVHSIHDAADGLRKKEFETSTPFEKTTFARCINNIDRELLLNRFEMLLPSINLDGEDAEGKTVGEVADTVKERKVSLFEIPMLYWKSLPKKDAAEIEIMVDAIIETLRQEITTFADKQDVDALLATYVRHHYDLLYKNYEACTELYDNYGSPAKENTAMKIIRKKVLESMDELDITKEDFRLIDNDPSNPFDF